MREHHTGISERYAAVAQGAGVFLRTDRGALIVSGGDRATYLQGLLTNDIVALRAGRGCYAAYLTAQGRMIADMWVYELGDAILVSLARDVKDTVIAKLDQFIFSEDVHLGDVSETFASVAVLGPDAAARIERVLDAGEASRAIAALPNHGNARAFFRGEPIVVLRITDTGLAGFELLVERPGTADLMAALHAVGVLDVDRETAEAFRIEAGVPLFHQDMDEDTLPLEAGLEERAISLTKGCYVGQEVIIRVLHRGHGRVAKKLVGLIIAANSAPPPTSIVKSDDREIGRITSSTMSPKVGGPIALAYLQRDFIAPGTAVTVGQWSALVSALPFVEGEPPRN